MESRRLKTTADSELPKQAKELEMRATAETRERKRRLWSLIQQHDPGMAALIEALSKTPGPWSDAPSGKSTVRAIAVNGEWSDGRAPEKEAVPYAQTDYAKAVREARK